MDSESKTPRELLNELEFLRRRVGELEAREFARDRPAAESDLFRRLVEHSLGLMCVHDLDGNLLFVNTAAAQALGFRPEDGFGLNLRSFLSPSVQGQFDAYLERIRTNAVDSGLMRVVAKHGTEQIWLYRNVLYEEPGKPPRVLGHAQDVTDRVRAEGALKESEQRFRLLADTAPVLIWMSDPSGACAFLNQPWLDFTGHTLGEQRGAGWIESVHAEDRDRFVEAYRVAVAAHAAFQAEFRLRRADGEYRWMLGHGRPRIDANGAFAGLIGSCVDVTEIRRAREVLETARDDLTALVAQRTAELERSNEQLRAEARYRAEIQEEVARARRIESVGVLAGGIAHEFNNLLTVIVGRSQLLLDRHPDALTRHDVDFIQRTVQRAAALTQQLLAFSRTQLLQPRLVNLTRLVAGMSLPTVIGEHIKLTLRTEEALWPVSVDPVQFQRAILDLVDNACGAMPAGGDLVLETANVDLDDSFVRSHPGARPGPHVRLTVLDTGAGIDEATRSRIFEPFFTAKPGVQGSGLCLPAVYGTTKQHGGYIAVQSELGRGTAVTIHLPAAGEVSPAAGEMPPPESTAPDGAETILLVEDEESVRLFLRGVLERHGYRVIEVEDPDEALALAERRSEPFHLVLTDVVMPRMSGPALADQLASIRPGVKVLYMSGHAADALREQGTLNQGVVPLEKPFTVTSLLERVRGALDG